MARMGRIGRALALGVVLLSPAAGCGGASDQGAAEPTAGGELPPEVDGECCCQRYDEEGSATGAITSDATACKSTGGTCIEDNTQCESE